MAVFVNHGEILSQCSGNSAKNVFWAVLAEISWVGWSTLGPFRPKTESKENKSFAELRIKKNKEKNLFDV